MERSRPNPIQLILALTGVVLAIVGVVRFGQGRPARHHAVAAVATTVSESTSGHTSGAAGATTDTTGDTTGAAAPATSDVSVDIVDFAFSPDPLEVAVGAQVTWTNKDGFAHTATANDVAGAAPFDSKSLAAGASYSYTFDKTGTFTYRCAIHNSMTGTVTVK